MAEPVVFADGFAYRYPGASAPALSDVTLSLEPGSFTVVAGESASGKSTLLRALVGLVPHFFGGDAGGELAVTGLSVREHGPAELAASSGAVLQEAESQVVMTRVRAQIALGLENRGHGPAAVARGVEEAALALGVGHLLDRSTAKLSGGELQRVALAAALAHRPSLLVLDEPTSQLDPVAGDELGWLLRRVNEEWGTAVVVAEHRLERCLVAADRVVTLEHGRIVHDASPPDFLRWAGDRSPALQTPGARLFSLAGLSPPPLSVKEARRALSDEGLAPLEPRAREESRPRRRRRGAPATALELSGVWLELRDGPALLSGIDLSIDRGERVALMGRNGAGKSTLLRVARGLAEPTRGRVKRGGEVALLLQTPGDYLVHERVRDEAPAQALATAGLAHRAAADPRDLSGGERQRLALEIVLDGEAPAAVCLDEPTRGMDRGHGAALAERVAVLAGAGAAVLVATHDAEFAAASCDRVVLMGQGTVIADGPTADVLAGGWHFSTEVARVLGGAGGALTPEQGARVLGVTMANEAREAELVRDTVDEPSRVPAAEAMT